MPHPLGDTFTLAPSGGDGRHPYLNPDGAFLGPNIALLKKSVDGLWQPRSAGEIGHLLTEGYGHTPNLSFLMGQLASVARALNKDDRSLAAIALVHAGLPPLPDDAAVLRLTRAEQLLKAETEHWPEQPRDKGKWAPEGRLPAKQRRLNDAGLDKIKAREGFSPRAYRGQDSQNQTIGFGHKLKPGESFPDGIDKPQATILLQQDLRAAEQTVRDSVKVDLTQGQYDALVSFTYNVGSGAFRDSTLLRLLNQGDYTGAAGQFPRWNIVNGKKSTGLAARRADQQNMFLGKK